MSKMRNRAGRRILAGIAASTAALLGLNQSASGQAYISAIGTFSTTNQHEDFYLTLPNPGNNLTLRTWSYTGGTNIAGQFVGPSAFDSAILWINANDIIVAANDDAHPQTLDAFLSHTGTGSTLLATQPAADYRVRMAAINGMAGPWAVDIVNNNQNLVLNNLVTTSGSVVADLAIGASGSFTSTLQLTNGAAANANTFRVQSGGVLHLMAGTVAATNLWVDGNSGVAGVAIVDAGTITANQLVVGRTGGGAGSLTLNSGWIAVNEFIGGDVGSSGNVTQNGGVLETGNFYLNRTSSSGASYTLNDGQLSVGTFMSLGHGGFGSGSFTQTGGIVTAPSLAVGRDGSGYLSQTGGFISIGDAAGVVVGASPASAGYGGSISLTGGSFDTYNLDVATGSVAVGGNAVASVYETTTIRSGSRVDLIGGTLNVGTIDVMPGGTFNFNSGTLGMLSNNIVLDNGQLLGNNLTLGVGKSLIVLPGLVTEVKPGSVLQLSGGRLSTGSLVNNGNFAYTSGTLELTYSPLQIGTDGLLGKNVQLNSGQHVNVTAFPIDVAPEGVLYLNGGSIQATSWVDNYGEIHVNSPFTSLTAATLYNSGLITGNGRFDAALENFNEIRILGGNSLRFTGMYNYNFGQMRNFGGVLEFTETLSNFPGGVISGQGGIIAPAIANSGSMLFSGGVTEVFSPVTNQDGGKIIVTGASSSTFYEDVTNDEGSEFRVSTGSTAVFFGEVVGLSQFTGAGVKVFEGPASVGALATSGSTVVETTGVLSTQHIRDNGLLVKGSVTIGPSPTRNDPAGASVVKSLAITPGGSLDLTNNSMIIDYVEAGALLDQVRDYLRNDQITSSTANVRHGIGYADNSVLRRTVLVGQPVDSTSLLLQYVLLGDSNFDGMIDVADLLAVATNWLQSDKYWTAGDFDYDGLVNQSDLALLAMNWQASPGDPPPLDPLLASLGLPPVAVPEPTLLSLTALTALTLTRRRRR